MKNGKNYTKPETNIERNILSDLLMIYDDINKTSFCNKNVALSQEVNLAVYMK